MYIKKHWKNLFIHGMQFSIFEAIRNSVTKQNAISFFCNCDIPVREALENERKMHQNMSTALLTWLSMERTHSSQDEYILTLLCYYNLKYEIAKNLYES